MKRVPFFACLMLAVFGLTLGMTLALADQAHATEPCAYQCEYQLSCQPNGPDCGANHQVWYHALCVEGPLNCPGDHWDDACCLF